MAKKLQGKRTWNILIVAFLAIFLHTWAVSLLPQDFDEPVYVQVGIDYANAIKAKDIGAIIDYPGSREHPALVKLLYSGAVLALGKEANWTNIFFACRAISAFFGVFAVILTALAIDPLAGGLLAVQTLFVKYTSQAYLEALPLFFSLAAVYMFLKMDKGKPNKWFWLSAIVLGMATAGKYTYIPVIVIVMVYIALFEKKIKIFWLLPFAFLAISSFFIFDITLWHDPINRIIESLSFHVQYSQGSHVQEVGYPWYQPFIWIFTSPPANWHPDVFFYFGFDGLISIFAVLGVIREWKERRWLVIWLVFGILFLLIWPTKWPQYTLIMVPTLCIMGDETLRRVWHWVREKETYWEYLREMIPKPSKGFWVFMGVFIFFIAVLYLSAQIKLEIGRIGWSHITQENSQLPGMIVNDLLKIDENTMLLATNHGAAIYREPASPDQIPTWTIYNTENSGLPDNQVLSLAWDSQGGIWMGTENGLAHFDGNGWNTFQSSDLNLSSDDIVSLAVDTHDNIYAGTLAGISFWNGETWTNLKDFSEDWPVFSIFPTGDNLWLGTDKGLWKITIISGVSEFYQTSSPIQDIAMASDGSLWVATSGSGVAHLVQGNWQYFKTSNSGMPSNLVNWVIEDQSGIIWAATSFSNSPGGSVVSFDGNNWHSFLKTNSGTSGSEPLVIIPDFHGEIWIGTRGAGVDTFKRNN